MYRIGEKVVYAAHGVCMVAAEECKTVDRKKVTYLVLEPVGQEGTRYLVPTHNASAMAKLRPMLTAEQLQELIHSDAVQAGAWIRDENHRKQVYRELIGSGDRVKLMQMVHTLYAHKKTQLAEGKKVHLCDDNFLRDAEKLLAGEFAIVLNMAPDAARQYLRNQLKAE